LVYVVGILVGEFSQQVERNNALWKEECVHESQEEETRPNISNEK